MTIAFYANCLGRLALYTTHADREAQTVAIVGRFFGVHYTTIAKAVIEYTGPDKAVELISEAVVKNHQKGRFRLSTDSFTGFTARLKPARLFILACPKTKQKG